MGGYLGLSLGFIALLLYGLQDPFKRLFHFFALGLEIDDLGLGEFEPLFYGRIGRLGALYATLGGQPPNFGKGRKTARRLRPLNRVF